MDPADDPPVKEFRGQLDGFGERLEDLENTVEGDEKGRWDAFATKDRFYVRRPDRAELYDLDADPHQLTNLAAEMPEEVAALSRRLNEL